MAMVKAFTYGLGTYEVAKLLEEHNIDYLGVANIYEGMEMRNAGIYTPILVMKPEVDSFDLVIENKLTPVIFSLYSLEKLLHTLKEYPVFSASNPIEIHLKFDTGMHRIGFDESDLKELLTLLSKYNHIKIAGVLSHLAASEDASEDDFTINQLAQFEKICTQVEKHLGYTFLKHILNSNGIIRFPNYQYDMVRLGIGLYGVCEDEHIQSKLLPVSTLYSKISQIKTIKKGDSIGYNRKHIARNSMQIATIPLGYADGLNRRLGCGNWSMIVNNKPAPIVGNVCMDMVMIDVTNINCKEGDLAFVFSKDNPIQEMSKVLGTIPYEIFTSYSPRVKREFSYS
ncbi:MAG: hypothetical protein Kow0079_08910 [Vicingaceae bacterium]